MNEKSDVIGVSGLQFFGSMTASISHEIKNVLAIINENAGLLEDLTHMAAKGLALEPERLRTLAGKVKAQVLRGDEIVKRLNRFAHSTDENEEDVDLGEMLELVSALLQRSASMRGVSLNVVPLATGIRISTSPFLLENLIWRCLSFIMEADSAARTISLFAEKAGTHVHIQCSCPQWFAGKTPESFPAEPERALARALRAQVAFRAGAGGITIILPRHIDP